MKKTISALLALFMAMSMMIAVNAEGAPKVYVDGSEILFGDDQAPVIVGEGTTLIPARVVFNAMGASVQWDEDLRRVQIDSEDNITRIYITIDNPIMEVYTFTSVFSSDKTEIELGEDAVPRIINDRTMIPLRAISESLNATVDWDQEAYTISITTAEAAETSTADISAVYLTSSPAAAAAGDTVDVYLNVSNLPEGTHISTITALVNYDKTAFEYTGCTLYADGADIDATISADNADYTDNGVKIALITTGSEINADGAIAKLSFTALTDNGGEFALENSYELTRGYNTALGATDDSGKVTNISGTALSIDTAAITVGGADEVTEDTVVDEEDADAVETADTSDTTDEAETTEAEETDEEDTSDTDETTEDAEETTEAE